MIYIPPRVDQWLELAEDGSLKLKADAPQRIRDEVRRLNADYRALYEKNLILTD